MKKAVDCFVACIGIDLYFASSTMKNCYAAWDNHPYTAHFAKYYDVALKRWTWLNGKILSQHEAVWPKTISSHNLELKIPGVQSL